MRSLFEDGTRAELKERLGRLTPGARARWGRMSAPQMVCHVGDQLRVALGDLPTREAPNFLRFRPLRQMFVYWLPWPKGKVPTSPEMQSSAPCGWEGDVAAVDALIDRFATRRPAEKWAQHPAFGRLSGREWGALCCKHLEHHLQQFGV